MSKTFTDDQIIDAVYRQGGYKPASRYLGMPESTLRARHKKATAKAGSESTDERLDIDEKDESCSLSYKGGNLRTVDDVLKFANVDMRFWDIDRKVISKWEVALKIHPGEDVKSGTDGKSHKVRGADSVETRDLFQIKVWLKRKAPKLVTDGLELFNEWASAYRPTYKPVKRQKISDPHMLEISIADAHFGKLAWDKEIGCDYDTEIANRIYREAFHDLLAKVQAYPIEEIVVPIGNDLFHIDNRIGSTEKGTLLDYDGRYPKIVGKVQQAIVEAVDSATSVAKVKLLFVPGNHDRTVSWHLMQYLSAWYRDNADVEVDMSPQYRKYVRYGVNLIGFTHGDQEPHRDLPSIMMSENLKDLEGVRCREFHLGHFHKKKETSYVSADTYGGTVIRVLPSISATDFWHYQKGYVGTARAAEAYLYSKDGGYTGHFSSNVREG